MASAETEDLDDSSSSGDVIIEHWSEGDSDDVICVESSNEDAAKDDPVKINPVMDDSDSDDCIILEKEVILDKEKEVVHVPPSLDCDSFEDFTRETGELVTSTPKHGQEVIAEHTEQDSHTTVVGESSDEDEDDTDDSDDNLVIVDEVASKHVCQEVLQVETTVNEGDVTTNHEAPKRFQFQNIIVREQIKPSDIEYDAALMVNEVGEKKYEAEDCDFEEERDAANLRGREGNLKDVEIGCSENKDYVKKVEAVKCVGIPGDGTLKKNISVKRAQKPEASVPFAKEAHESASVQVPKKAYEPVSVSVPKKAHGLASGPVPKKALEHASVPVLKIAHEVGSVPVGHKSHESVLVSAVKRAHEPASVPASKRAHVPASVPVPKKAYEPAPVPVPKKAHGLASVPVPKKVLEHASMPVPKEAHEVDSVPVGQKSLESVLVSAVKRAHEPASVPAAKRAHVPASVPSAKIAYELVFDLVGKNGDELASVTVPKKAHEPASVPVAKKTHEPASVPVPKKVHEPVSVPLAKKAHESVLIPAIKRADEPASVPVAKIAHESASVPISKKFHWPSSVQAESVAADKRTHAPESVSTAMRAHKPVSVRDARRDYEPDPVPTSKKDRNFASVPAAKRFHEPANVPVAKKARKPDSVLAAKRVNEPASVPATKRAHEPAASVPTSKRAQEPDLIPAAKRPGFVFGSTAVLASQEVPVPVREEVSLSEQRAMSSEEEQENMEEEEKGGEFWLKMITGGASGSVVETSEAHSQAWSAEEKEGQTGGGERSEAAHGERKREIVVESKVKDVDNGEDSDDDKISLAPSEEMFSDDNNEVKDENNNKDEDVGDSDDDLHLAIYSLGNYCKRMVRGILCSKAKCSWVHYMDPVDAVTQFYRICSNRSVSAVFRFYRFFTNLEVQEQMVVEAQELLTRTDPDEVIDVDAKQVCMDVFKAMVKVSKGLDLSLDQYMEMVDISSSLYTIKDGKEILVSLFHQTHVLLADAGPHPAAPRLLRWSWTSLYLDSLSNGVVLSAQFYSDICTLLASLKMIPQLVVVMLYTALVPSLSTPLVPLAEVLTCPPSVLTTPHTTATVTAQTLSRLCTSEWVALSKLGTILPGIALLVNTLKTDNPAEVHKFFDSLPELPGLEIPSVPPPGQTQLDFWIRQKLAGGKWEEVAYHFCSIDQQEVEAISEMAEKVLLELSQLCGEFKLVEPIPAVYATMLPVVMSRECEVHTQFFRQLGVALMMCAVNGMQWGEAGALVKLLANNQLNTDFMAVKPPALSQFSSLDRGMVPLFVLEVLVWTKQRMELVKYLELWDCLASMETELEQEKNNIIISVLECLASGNSDMANVDIMIRISDVMVPGMRTETNVVLRRRQEGMSNILFQLMLNLNMSGSRLWSRYQMVRSCHHQLHKAETRGIVFMLANSRMHPQAREVYLAAVKWGVYSVQATSRPFTLRLASNMTLEEIYVIVMEFLTRVEAEQHQESMNIFVKMEVTNPPNSGIKHINCIRSSKNEAMSRVEHVLKMLEPPLELTHASVPYVREELVRRFLVLKQQNS